MTTETTAKLPSAIPVENKVFCTECDDIHELWDGKVTLDSSETCEAASEAYVTIVDQLPAGWESEYHAEFYNTFYNTYDLGGTFRRRLREQYKLIPKSVDPLPCHRPMYYLEEV